MKICHIICDITSGGVESVIQNYISKADDCNNEYELISYGIKSDICYEKFIQLGFTIHIIHPKSQGLFRSIREMNQILRKGRFDAVHAHLTEWNCIPMYLAWKNRVPIRISHSHMYAFPKGAEKIFLGLQRRINLLFATKLCACGKDAGIYLYGKKRYESGKVVVLNNAIDLARFSYNPSVRKRMRDYIGIDDNTLCIGHIGRFLEQKNHTFLIDIYKNVFTLNKNSILILLGTGELENEIKTKVIDNDLQKNVIFLGIQDRPEDWYQAMDVFCLPSLYEGLPVVGIEAQAAGVPCVVSDTISEQVRITPLVTMCSLKDTPQKWASVILASRRRMFKFPKEFDIGYNKKSWESLYMTENEN